MDITIYYEDTDATGIVYHANYIKYCDRARSKYFFDNNIELEKMDGHLIIHSLQCQYLTPARLGNELNIQSTITKLKKTSLEIEHIILKNDQTVFKMQIKMLYVVDMKPSVFPVSMLKMFNAISNDNI